MAGKTGWPVNVVLPDMEDHLDQGLEQAQEVLTQRLAEDYTPETDRAAVDARGWYGRCVYSSDNDVCDNQVVTITWEDESSPEGSECEGQRGAKTATFNMVAFTADTSRRHTRVFGTRGEIVADSRTVTVSASFFFYIPRLPARFPDI